MYEISSSGIGIAIYHEIVFMWFPVWINRLMIVQLFDLASIVARLYPCVDIDNCTWIDTCPRKCYGVGLLLHSNRIISHKMVQLHKYSKQYKNSCRLFACNIIIGMCIFSNLMITSAKFSVRNFVSSLKRKFVHRVKFC